MNLEPMWEALQQYQKYAEQKGFGAEWKRMTTERNLEASDAASDAAFADAEKSDEPYLQAPSEYAAWSAEFAARTMLPSCVIDSTKYWSSLAIEEINLAIEWENKA